MDILQIENLSFTYPSFENNPPLEALKNISLNIKEGEFSVVCGASGSGKSTLIRLIKKELAPKGERSGNIFVFGKDSSDISSEKIGYVSQNPDSQIVTDKVWHELAFGLENMGMGQMQMFRLVGEMAACFGLEKQYNSETNVLSGGEKQILNLAGVLVMHPRLLLLDEPTAQLDPISASRFLYLLKRLNEEWGTTIVLVEHRLEDCIPLADRLIVLKNGCLLADDRPEKLMNILQTEGLGRSFPASMQLAALLGEKNELPLTVKSGRKWLREYLKHKEIAINLKKRHIINEKKAIEAKDVWFSYDKKSLPVIKGLDISLYYGQVMCILGGNGSGKSTLLSVLGKIRKPVRGRVVTYASDAIVLPQNPESIFTADTVGEELDLFKTETGSKADKDIICDRLKVTDLLSRNPYDLSGGEQQLCALAKILLKNSKCILLDEPTKGMDVQSKKIVMDVLRELADNGAAVLVVTHDVAVAAELADTCVLFFDGKTSEPQEVHEFFAGNNFYIPPISRILKDYEAMVISIDEIAAT